MSTMTNGDKVFGIEQEFGLIDYILRHYRIHMMNINLAKDWVIN